jgi:hypothetical protein
MYCKMFVKMSVFSLDRTAFVVDLRQAIASLASLQPTLTEVTEQQRSLVGLVTQRLKWAAGANPTLAEVYTNFYIN